MTVPRWWSAGPGCKNACIPRRRWAGFHGLTGAGLVLLFCLHVHLVCPSLSAVPEPPRNLSLTDIQSRSVTIQWVAPLTDQVTLFEMIVQPLGEIKYPGKTVEGTRRSVLLPQLRPDTEYEVTIRAVNSEGVSNLSCVLTFKTLSDTMEAEVARLHVRFGEVTVVALILAAWMAAVAAFLHKWGKIRIITNREYRYKHNPKNIDTIKVVKRPTDSVIYKSYTREVSKTMLAREKRIERMNTMPNISLTTLGVTEEPESKPIASGKKFSRFKTMPVIELDELTSETQT